MGLLNRDGFGLLNVNYANKIIATAKIIPHSNAINLFNYFMYGLSFFLFVDLH